jgi:hypothetical protein
MRYAPILIALAVASTAHAEGDRTLHLALHGSIDGAAIGPALATELGVEVAVADGTCELPCLDVTVDGKHTATIMFAPRSGTPRARTVALGNDTTQWPLVITLLAGNVVRDEAQDVLAGLPSGHLPAPAAEALPAEVPPAPAPAPAAEATPADAPPALAPDLAPAQGTGPVMRPGPSAEPEPEHRFLGLGFVPGLSTDLTHIGSVRHFLSIDLLVGVSGGSSGLSLSGIADVERGLVAGFQVAGVAAIARRVAGTQVAGVAAVAGDVDGVQIAGTAAVAARIDGVQIGGVAAVSRASADTQIAGVAAVAHGRAGLQIGGVAAVAGGDANVQAGGVTSVARGTANIQIAGVVNVARRVRGIQLAPINVAREVDGIQIGVINVGGSADGFSFGLINIVPGGRYDLETAIDSNKTGTVLFRHGGRRWHNVYGIGGHPVKETGPSDDVWMYGLGFGPSLAFDHTVIDLEAIGWQVNHGPRHDSDVSILGQLRLSVAQHWGPFAIVAGGILNAYVTNDAQSPLMLERRATSAPMATGVTVTTWPSAFIGLRI